MYKHALLLNKIGYKIVVTLVYARAYNNTIINDIFAAISVNVLKIC